MNKIIDKNVLEKKLELLLQQKEYECNDFSYNIDNTTKNHKHTKSQFIQNHNTTNQNNINSSAVQSSNSLTQKISQNKSSINFQQQTKNLINMKYFIEKKQSQQNNIMQNPGVGGGGYKVNPLLRKKVSRLKTENFYNLHDSFQSSSQQLFNNSSSLFQQQQSTQSENKYSRNMKTKLHFQKQLTKESEILSQSNNSLFNSQQNYHNLSTNIMNNSIESNPNNQSKSNKSFISLNQLRYKMNRRTLNQTDYKEGLLMKRKKSFYQHDNIYKLQDYKTLYKGGTSSTKRNSFINEQIKDQQDDTTMDRQLRQDFRMKVVNYLIELQYSKNGANSRYEKLPIKNNHNQSLMKSKQNKNDLSLLDQTTILNTEQDSQIASNLDEHRFCYYRSEQPENKFVEVICYDTDSGQSLKKGKVQHDKIQNYLLDNMKYFLNDDKVDYDSKIEQAEKNYQLLLEKLKENAFIVKIPVELKIANQDFNDFYAIDEEYFLRLQMEKEALRRKQMYERQKRHINSRNKSVVLKYDFGLHATTSSSDESYESSGSDGPRMKSPMPSPENAYTFDFDAALKEQDKILKKEKKKKQQKVYDAVGGDKKRGVFDNSDPNQDSDEDNLLKKPNASQKKKKKKKNQKMTVQELLKQLEQKYDEEDLQQLRRKIKKKQQGKKYSVFSEPLNLQQDIITPEKIPKNVIQETDRSHEDSSPRQRVYKARGGDKLPTKHLNVEPNLNNKKKKSRLSNINGNNNAIQVPSNFQSPSNMSMFDINDESDENKEPTQAKPVYKKKVRKKEPSNAQEDQKKQQQQKRKGGKEKVNVHEEQKLQKKKSKKEQEKDKTPKNNINIQNQIPEDKNNKVDTPKNVKKKRKAPGKKKIDKNFEPKKPNSQFRSHHNLNYQENNSQQNSQQEDSYYENSYIDEESDYEEEEKQPLDENKEVRFDVKDDQPRRKKATSLHQSYTYSFKSTDKLNDTNKKLQQSETQQSQQQQQDDENPQPEQRKIKKKRIRTVKKQRLENGKIVLQTDMLDKLSELQGIDDFNIYNFKNPKEYPICAPPYDYEDEEQKQQLTIMLKWEAQVYDENAEYLKKQGRKSLIFGKYVTPEQSSEIASEDQQSLVLDSDERKLAQEKGFHESDSSLSHHKLKKDRKFSSDLDSDEDDE